MTYTGGKNGSGVYQKIISLMPKHKVYIEGFLGAGAILKKKKPAKHNIGIEIDPKVYAELWKDNHKFIVRNESFAEFLTFSFDRDFINFDTKDILFYLDPPYLPSTRKTQHQIYSYNMREVDHLRLLMTVKRLPYYIMISGYESDLYNEHLKDWRKFSFSATSRGGGVTETVWMNFDEPFELHDYSYLGANYRDRERIKQKRKRWKNRLLKLNNLERQALFATIEELKEELRGNRRQLHK